VRQGGSGGGSRRLRREELAEGCGNKGSSARNQRRGLRQVEATVRSVVPMATAGQRGHQAVWESEWQWRIERANVLRMNGPNSGEREGLSLRGPCTTKDRDRSER
jgi:hypothetical protein